MSWFIQTPKQVLATIYRKIRIRDILLVTGDDGTLRLRDELDASYQSIDVASLYLEGTPLRLNPAILWDQKVSGLDGGTSSNAAWNARDLNTVHSDRDGIVSLNPSTGRFRPVHPAWYWCTALTPYLGGTAGSSFARARIFNVSTSTAEQAGFSGRAITNDATIAITDVIFEANGVDEYRVDTFTTVGRATNGLGVAVVDGAPEIYTVVILRELP